MGVCSARKIEPRVGEDVGFRVLAAGNAPDFRTMADFRKIHRKALEGFFEQVLRVALEGGAVQVGRVERRKRKLQTKAGAAIYVARQAIVEPVFGQIKQARGFRRFSMRGLTPMRFTEASGAIVSGSGSPFEDRAEAGAGSAEGAAGNHSSFV